MRINIIPRVLQLYSVLVVCTSCFANTISTDRPISNGMNMSYASSTIETTSATTINTEMMITTPVNISDLFPTPKKIYICRTMDDTFTITCNNADYVIGIVSIKLGFLNKNDICSANNSTTGCEENPSKTLYRLNLDNMSGQKYVHRRMPFQSAYGSCNQGVGDSDYSIVDYDCIAVTDIRTMCSPSNGTNDILYVQSDGYPNKMEIGGRCHCDINITANTLVVQLFDNGINSSQQLDLREINGTHLTTWRIDNNFRSITTNVIRAKGSFLRLEWDGGNIIRGARNGKFLMRLRAADESPMSIRCYEPETITYYKEIGDALPATRMTRQCGNETNELSLTLNCERVEKDRVIAVHSVDSGFLLHPSKCNSTTADRDNNVGENACEQDSSKARYMGDPDNPSDKGVLGYFSGRGINQMTTVRMAGRGECADDPKPASYSVGYYDCVKKSSIGKMCVPSVYDEDIVYVWNEGYPESGDMKLRSCNCIINTNASKFYVQVYDNRMDCSQGLDIGENDTTILSLGCDNYFNHIKTYFLKTRGGKMTLHWKSINGTNTRLGKFWIRILAVDRSKLNMQCFNPILPTTTTTTTTTTAPINTEMTNLSQTWLPTYTRQGPVSSSTTLNTNVITKDKQYGTESTYCIPKYIVYAVGGGFCAILLVFITGCILQKRSRNKAEGRRPKINEGLEMGRIDHVNKDLKLHKVSVDGPTERIKQEKHYSKHDERRKEEKIKHPNASDREIREESDTASMSSRAHQHHRHHGNHGRHDKRSGDERSHRREHRSRDEHDRTRKTREQSDQKDSQRKGREEQTELDKDIDNVSVDGSRERRKRGNRHSKDDEWRKEEKSKRPHSSDREIIEESDTTSRSSTDHKHHRNHGNHGRDDKRSSDDRSHRREHRSRDKNDRAT